MMNNYIGRNREVNIAAYRRFANLCNILEKFSLAENNEEVIKELKAMVRIDKSGMPLPSGRWGNPLAVALEMRFHKGISFMIQHAKDLEIDLNFVSSEYGGGNIWNVEQAFAVSQLGFEKTEITNEDEFYEDTIRIMEQNRIAYMEFAKLHNVLKKFSFDENNEEVIRKLKITLKTFKGAMPLPSGRWGNSLAVALEMQYYQGALFMIQHADELGIDLESVSSEYDGSQVWNAKQTFEQSQLGFEETKIDPDDKFYSKYPWLIESNNRNVDAHQKLYAYYKTRNREKPNILSDK